MYSAGDCSSFRTKKAKSYCKMKALVSCWGTWRETNHSNISQPQKTWEFWQDKLFWLIAPNLLRLCKTWVSTLFFGPRATFKRSSQNDCGGGGGGTRWMDMQSTHTTPIVVDVLGASCCITLFSWLHRLIHHFDLDWCIPVIGLMMPRNYLDVDVWSFFLRDINLNLIHLMILHEPKTFRQEQARKVQKPLIFFDQCSLSFYMNAHWTLFYWVKCYQSDMNRLWQYFILCMACVCVQACVHSRLATQTRHWHSGSLFPGLTCRHGNKERQLQTGPQSHGNGAGQTAISRVCMKVNKLPVRLSL